MTTQMLLATNPREPNIKKDIFLVNSPFKSYLGKRRLNFKEGKLSLVSVLTYLVVKSFFFKF